MSENNFDLRKYLANNPLLTESSLTESDLRSKIRELADGILAEKGKKKKKEKAPDDELDVDDIDSVEVGVDLGDDDEEMDFGGDEAALDNALDKIDAVDQQPAGSTSDIITPLNQALDAAKEAGDVKLIRQIGNTITYATRASLKAAEGSPVLEMEDEEMMETGSDDIMEGEKEPYKSKLRNEGLFKKKTVVYQN